MKRLVLVFFIAFKFTGVLAQAPHFQNYFLLRKNESIQVNKIFQDRTGFIWVATNKGLFQLDGYSIKRFTLNDSLPDIQVTALAQDSLGRIWTGHRNGSLAYYENNKFVKVEPAEGSASQEISDIIFDRKGRLWFSTFNDGLYYFLNDRLYRLDDQEGLPDLFIYDLQEDNQGNIWAGSDGGAIKLHLGKELKVEVVNYKNGLPDNIIKKVIVHGKNLLLATEDAGLLSYNPADKTVKPLISNWSYGAITDVVVKDDELWIATKAGLCVYNIKAQQHKVYAEKQNRSFASLRSLLKDSEGSIWVGSKFGLTRTHGDGLEFISIEHPANDKNILAIAVDEKQSIWFSNNEGLFKRSVIDGEVVTENILSKTKFWKNKIISLYFDRHGYLWAGLYGEGVLRIQPSTGNITHLNNELRNGNVLSITGKGDSIWLATLGGSSLITLEEKRFVVKNFGRGDGLSSDFIYQVFVDSQHRVWFGTDGKGVTMMDAKGFHQITKGLPSQVVYGFAEDGKGTIYANVQAAGIFAFNENQFVAFEGQTKLRDLNVQSFSSDDEGNLLIMHDIGIDVYDVTRNKIKYLGEEVGLRETIANLNVLSKDQFGHIYIGTNSGIIKYSGTGYQESTPKPFIQGVRVYNKPVNLDERSILSHDEDNITISFLGLWYQNPGNLYFQYKLVNYDHDWITTRDHAVTYSKLPPGTYTFVVKASDVENFDEAQDSVINFTIKPPFWRTTLFYIITVALLAGLAYAYVKYRERTLRLEKLVLENKVLERTLEIQKNNEEIQAQNEEITAQAEEIRGINENLEMIVHQRTFELERKNKALEEYAFINAHKLRSPVASILGLTNLMSKSNSEHDMQEISKRLHQAAAELDEIVHAITKTIEQAE